MVAPQRKYSGGRHTLPELLRKQLRRSKASKVSNFRFEECAVLPWQVTSELIKEHSAEVTKVVPSAGSECISGCRPERQEEAQSCSFV